MAAASDCLVKKERSAQMIQRPKALSCRGIQHLKGRMSSKERRVKSCQTETLLSPLPLLPALLSANSVEEGYYSLFMTTVPCIIQGGRQRKFMGTQKVAPRCQSFGQPHRRTHLRECLCTWIRRATGVQSRGQIRDSSNAAGARCLSGSMHPLAKVLT